MARKTGGKRLTGLNPLAYLGVEAETPANFFAVTRAPTVNDYNGYDLGDIWLYEKPSGTNDVYMLISKDVADPNGPAFWTLFGSGPGEVVSLTGNSGGPVFSDTNNNINVVGDNTNNINIVGTPGSFTLTASVSNTTNHAVQVGNAAGSLTSLPVGTNGQVLLGATAADPAFATLTSTAGTITYTTGVNSLNLDVTNWVNTTVWTPTLTFGGASVGMTYMTRTGSYSRIGNNVFFFLAVELTAKGSSTGVAKIEGLNFTPSGQTAVSLRYWNMNISYAAEQVGAFAISGNEFYLQSSSAISVTTYLNDTNFNDSTLVEMNGVFIF